MIIKNLFIVSNEGRTYFHYKSETSDYEIDLNLFSGFIAALSVFTLSLSDQKKLEFLKLGTNDDMYFTVTEDIIVASIMNASGMEQRVVDYLLKFIGKKFLDKYFVHIKKPAFNWDSIAEEFTQEIENIWTTDELYEKTKRDLISEFMAKALEKELSTEILQWRITSLFLNSSPDEVEKALEKIHKFRDDLDSMTSDPLLRAGLKESLDNIVTDLSKSIPKKSGTLLVLSDNREFYEQFYRKCLGYRLFNIPVNSVDDLRSVVTYWKEETPYNIIYMKTSISYADYEKLKKIPSKGTIFLWVRDIPLEIENDPSPSNRIKIIRQLPSFNELFSKITKESNIVESV